MSMGPIGRIITKSRILKTWILVKSATYIFSLKRVELS